MKSSRLLFSIGAWSFLLLGVGHLATQLQLMRSPGPRPAVFEAMESFQAPVLGPPVDLLSLYYGFSLMMGILLVAVGWLGLFFLKREADFPLRGRSLLVFYSALSLITLVLSLRFFFIVPVAFSLVCLVSFVAAWLFCGK